MKDTFSAYAIFELAMFAIMLLFLSFCGFFTFKHCFYIWKKKKRKRRDHSLESILDLLYNEDYYYLESNTPYLPDDDDETDDDLPRKISEETGNNEGCFDSEPSQGRGVKWMGPEKISIDKYKVCPQAVKTHSMHTRSIDESTKPKLKRQIKFQLSDSSDVNSASKSPRSDDLSFASVSGQDQEIPFGQRPVAEKEDGVVSCDEPAQSTADYGEMRNDCEEDGESFFKQKPKRSESKYPRKAATVSIQKLIATSKFIGAAHRARKKLRMQTRFPTGTFRYRSESNDECSESPRGSFEKRSPQKGHSPSSRHQVKRKVNFLDQHASSPRDNSAHTRSLRQSDERVQYKHAWSGSKKRDRKFGSPRSAFTSFPEMPVVSPDDVGGDHHHKKSQAGDAEELYQKYERLEKRRYTEMLKKTKAFRRDNLPFFHRKHSSS